MKKYLLIFTFISFLSLQAQLDYSLTNSTSTYTELSGATNISVAAWNSNFSVAMPFQFKYFGNTYSNLYITFDGCYFSDTGDDYVFYGTDNFKAENLPNSSPISYLITGTSPNRIIKIEWKNVREANSDPSFDYILNNQIWLYETSNIIEFHFGNNSVTDPVYDEFFIGLIDFDNSPYYAIDGSATSPVLVRVQNSGTFDGIPAYPTNGLVYTLTPKVSDIETILKPYTFSSDFNKFSINTSTDFIVNITDINGKAIDTNRFQSDANGTYFLSDIAAGIYLVNIQIGNNQFVEKIIVR